MQIPRDQPVTLPSVKSKDIGDIRARNATLWIFKQNFALANERKYSTLDVQGNLGIPPTYDLLNVIKSFGGEEEKDFTLITEDENGRVHRAGRIPTLTIIIKTELLEAIKGQIASSETLPSTSTLQEILFVPTARHDNTIFSRKMRELDEANK